MNKKSIHTHNSAEISHILGIDFGKAKLGLALADSETRIASGYDTIKNDKDMLVKLEKIIAQKNVQEVVIGVPGYVFKHDEEYDQKSLGKLLEVNTGVRVEYSEEMFTTKMAQANLREKGVKKVSKRDDQEAARIILQSWLDK